MGIRGDVVARRDHADARAEAAAQVLDRDQPAPRAVREARLHRASAQMLDVPGARVLPAGRGDIASLGARHRPLRTLDGASLLLTTGPSRRIVAHGNDP